MELARAGPRWPRRLPVESDTSFVYVGDQERTLMQDYGQTDPCKLIVLDDPVKDPCAGRVIAERDAVSRWLDRLGENVGPVRWHQSDLIGRLIDQDA